MKELCKLFPRRLLEGQVGRQDEFIFELRSKENGHNRPHIHAKSSQGELSIDISSFEIIKQSGRFRSGAIEKAKEWVAANSNMLRQKWN